MEGRPRIVARGRCRPDGSAATTPAIGEAFGGPRARSTHAFVRASARSSRAGGTIAGGAPGARRCGPSTRGAFGPASSGPGIRGPRRATACRPTTVGRPSRGGAGTLRASPRRPSGASRPMGATPGRGTSPPALQGEASPVSVTTSTARTFRAAAAGVSVGLTRPSTGRASREAGTAAGREGPGHGLSSKPMAGASSPISGGGASARRGRPAGAGAPGRRGTAAASEGASVAPRLAVGPSSSRPTTGRNGIAVLGGSVSIVALATP